MKIKNKNKNYVINIFPLSYKYISFFLHWEEAAGNKQLMKFSTVGTRMPTYKDQEGLWLGTIWRDSRRHQP